MKALPNILTGARIVLSVLVFLLLLYAAFQEGAAPLPEAVVPDLFKLAFAGFVIAAITDFFDGWLARKYQATSLLGAVLDPIADKILVAGAIVALAAQGDWAVALPGGLILFREFSVSALREVLAPKGLTLPVTVLAKWKTTVQLIALAVILFSRGWASMDIDETQSSPADFVGLAGLVLLWAATLMTLWTGIEYGLAAKRALAAKPE